MKKKNRRHDLHTENTHEKREKERERTLGQLFLTKIRE